MSIKKYHLDLKNGVVDMSHGSGGRATAQLIQEIFYKAFNNPLLGQGDDACVIPLDVFDSNRDITKRLVLTTDAHVVSPLFFPGGDIGSLSINGTVNDLAMSGADPKYITASFILEEGLPLAQLAKIANSMATAALACGVLIVAGDTKVVEKGKGDGIFISTTGIGYVDKDVDIPERWVRGGDNTGNLYNIDNIIAFRQFLLDRSRARDKCSDNDDDNLAHIITADGGFNNGLFHRSRHGGYVHRCGDYGRGGPSLF